MHAKFQASSFNGVQGEWGDRWKDGRATILAQSIMKFLNPPKLQQFASLKSKRNFSDGQYYLEF